MGPTHPMRFVRFGPFQLDLRTEELRRNGVKVRVPEQSLKVLAMLVKSPGELVTRNELHHALWPEGTIVEFDRSINAAVGRLREALEDSAGEPKFIETLPRRGYRFLVSVEQTDSTLPAPTREAPGLSWRTREESVPPAPSRQQSSFQPGLATLVATLAAACLFAYKLYTRQPAPSPFHSMRFTKLTTSGNVRLAAITPDGKYVVHVVEDVGGQSLWVRQVATASNVQIVSPAEVQYWGVTTSPDSNYVYFVRREREDPDTGFLYRIPILGGEPRRLVVDVDSRATVSSDGRRLAFVRNSENGSALVTAEVDGSRELIVDMRKGTETFGWGGGPAWSPDGIFIAGRWSENIFSSHLTAIRADGRGGKSISSRRWIYAGQLAWLSDGSGVLLTASDNASSPDSQIWLVSYPDGKIRRITNDPNSYAGVDVTADSTTLVAVQTEVHSRMWIMPASDSSRAHQATSGAGNDDAVGRISWTSDGGVVYGKSGGRRSLWIIDSNSGSAMPLAVSPQIDEDPWICGNSGYVVFSSNRTGGSNIWRMPLDGGSPVQLTRGNVDRLPTCSPDGKWVFYQSERASGSRVWRVPTEGGEPTQIADKFSFGVAVSPSGEWVSYIWDVGTKVAIARPEGGAPVKILDISPSVTPGLRWAPDSHALTYIDTVNGVSNIWRLPLDGTPARPITNFKSDRIFSHSWSRDGKYLALARGTVTSDAVLISNFR